jgi:hypothetical protein
MKEIYSVTRISSEDFANRCGKEVTEYFNNIVKNNSKRYKTITDIQGKHCCSDYINFINGFMERTFLSDSATVYFTHDAEKTTRANFLCFVLRQRIVISTIRKYYETFGIILDEDLRDLKIII